MIGFFYKYFNFLAPVMVALIIGLALSAFIHSARESGRDKGRSEAIAEIKQSIIDALVESQNAKTKQSIELFTGQANEVQEKYVEMGTPNSDCNSTPDWMQYVDAQRGAR